MTMSEWRGHRQIEDQKPDHKDWIITFNLETDSDTVPALGNGAQSFGASAALGASGFHKEPEAIWKSNVYRVTDKTGRVTVRFRGFYTE
jgi:hypothetical protein